MLKKFIIGAVVLILAIVGIGAVINSANASAGQPGDSPDNPIVVKSLSDIPSDAELSAVKNEDCSTTTTGVVIRGGFEEQSHQEYQYSREVPAVEESSHLEWGVQERTRSEDTVTDYVTQYHFRKFTHTKTRAPAGPDLWWNWSPNHTEGPQDYVPAFPSDNRGTWQGPHENGGPMQNTYGTFQTGGGNSPFFHREHGTPQGEWSAYGPWTAWVPETHESWQDSTDPLGSPEFHGQGTYSDGTMWYREWQAQFDGETRQVEAGTHEVFGDWSDWADVQTHLLTEPTLQADTDIDQFRLVGPIKVVDQEAVPGYTEYYVEGGEPSQNVVDASWILADTLEGWTQFNERKVIDHPTENSYLVWYAYNDGVKCDTPPPPHHNPPHHNTPNPAPPVKHNTPAVPTVIEAGL